MSFTIGEARQLLSPITGQPPESVKGMVLITIDQDHNPRMFGSLSRSGMLKVLAYCLQVSLIAEAMGTPEPDDDDEPNPLASMPADADALLRAIFGDDPAGDDPAANYPDGPCGDH